MLFSVRRESERSVADALLWRCVTFNDLVARIDVDPDAQLPGLGGSASRVLYPICFSKSMPPICNTGDGVLHSGMEVVVGVSRPSRVSSSESEPAEHEFPNIGAVEPGG